MDGYSRLVAYLKVLLPLTALALMSTVFLLSRGVETDAVIPFAQKDLKDRTSGQQITAPFFSGTTTQGDEIMVTAQSARPGGANGPATAIDLQAEKLILLTSAPGLLADPTDPDSLISHISARRGDSMLETGAIQGGMVPKLTTLIESVRAGVPRAHILDGKSPHSLLLELFTKDGSGTMVTTREEEKRYLDE